MPKSLFILTILLSLLYSCSKDNHKPAPPTGTIKINLLSGDNQSSGIGYPVNDSILVKVTQNGNPLGNAVVQFTGSGCNSDLSFQLKTKADGTVKYLWRLAANQGAQTLSAVVMDGTSKVDSVTIHATATSPAPGGFISACTPYSSEALNIVSLSTGRLLSCFSGKNSLRYSDDNGVSWNPVKSFGAGHSILTVVTSPQDEIFVGTKDDGVFYSKDLGNTWTDITPFKFNKSETIADMGFSDGSLMFTGSSSDFFTSPDKGKSWTSSVAGLPANFTYMFPYRLNNGDLYVLSMGLVLFKSTDGGANWTEQNTLPDGVLAICVDNNGWFYKSSFSNPNGGVVYISKDNGQTFSVLYKVNGFVNTMNLLADGFIYYSDFFNLYKISNIIDNQGQYPTHDNISQTIGQMDLTLSNRSFLINQKRLFYVRGGLIRY
ncbi:MAG TPA: sialidase family protein [Mucilaginibacter sp.]|nr:sialidase family protein [Mucilaginibacter sp.]